MDRADAFRRTLGSLDVQGISPAELIVVDASHSDETRSVVELWGAARRGATRTIWKRAVVAGAAAQRNQGVALATQPFIWFFDDDIVFEADCVARLWRAIVSDAELGGVNAMITNQRYQRPGYVSRTVFSLLAGGTAKTFAGRVLGPAVNLLPEDREDLPEVVPTEWLNTTCTIYRREALPDPPFDSIFTGYSIMEDLTLSLRVGKRWRLANARTARIFHDSQPGEHKSDITVLAEMDLVNRHYVMTRVLKRTRMRDYAGLFVWQVFQLLATRREIQAQLRGKFRALRRLLTSPPYSPERKKS
jgi:GT2 family glycosyltransferase